MEIIKKRSIDIAEMEPFQFLKLEKDFSDEPGINELTMDEKGAHLQITYNLGKITLKQIVNRIENSGIHLKKGIWSRWKLGWQFYMKQNEWENLNTPTAPCCSNPDNILHKKG